MPDYKRVLPPISETTLPSRADLERLGRAMTMPAERELFADGCRPNGPRAGYTYLGQFIDHDITEDHSKVPDDNGAIVPEQIPNEATPWLDLHHVYGDGPDLSKPWYDQTTPDDAKLFRLDPTVSGLIRPDLKGAKLDLPRDACGCPLMPDSRNCENLVIAQLHVLFLRWHNLAVSQIANIKCPELLGITRFERARCLVTWNYQYLVRKDYLTQIISETLLKEFREHPKFFKIQTANEVFVPVEFSAAAFRFGHSMVRQSYRINAWQNQAHQGGVVPVADLVENARNFTALPHDWLIDWSRFFPGHGHQARREPAQQINTQLAPALHGVAIPTVQKFSDVQGEREKAGGINNKIDLPVRTLLRGRALRLCTGQKAAEEFEETRILGDQHLDTDPHHYLLPSFRELRDLGLANTTPLFYYILWEAERTQCGNRLGRVGGRIVAEVIEGLLKHDPRGYMKNTKEKENWMPPSWFFADGERPIEHFNDVMDLLNAWLPPGHPPISRPSFLDRVRYQLEKLRIYFRSFVGIIGVHKCWR
jgi:hypothetical protein